MDYTGKKLIFMGRPDDFSDEALERFSEEFIAALTANGFQFAEEPMAMPRASRPTKAKRPRSK